MIKDILQYPKDKELLAQKSEDVIEINEEIKELVKDLTDTLLDKKTGVGISAIQIGIPKKICIIKYNGNIYSMINPIITRQRGEMKLKEGCLSADPDIMAETTRAQKVWCEYTDIDGKKQEVSQGGLFSAIIQHELEHFEGTCKVFEEVDVQEKIKQIQAEMAAKNGMEYNEGVPVKTHI